MTHLAVPAGQRAALECSASVLGVCAAAKQVRPHDAFRAPVRRDFPRWKLWRWPGLWLERRRCRRMAAQGPLKGVSFDGVARRDGDQITQCEINEMRLVAPPGYEERR